MFFNRSKQNSRQDFKVYRRAGLLCRIVSLGSDHCAAPCCSTLLHSHCTTDESGHPYLPPNLPDLLRINTMASSAGTMRGTPNRNQTRGTVPAFTNSPASSIPRPALEHTSTAAQSEAGGSTMSASRQKQTKRDEVCLFTGCCCYYVGLLTCAGNPQEDRDGSPQEEAYN